MFFGSAKNNDLIFSFQYILFLICGSLIINFMDTQSLSYFAYLMLFFRCRKVVYLVFYIIYVCYVLRRSVLLYKEEKLLLAQPLRYPVTILCRHICFQLSAEYIDRTKYVYSISRYWLQFFIANPPEGKIYVILNFFIGVPALLNDTVRQRDWSLRHECRNYIETTLHLTALNNVALRCIVFHWIDLPSFCLGSKKMENK